MDDDPVEVLTRFSGSYIKDSQKKSLDGLFTATRKDFIFDNLAIYLQEGENESLEVVYARASGRGRSKEDEAAWGEEFASRVINTGKPFLSTPENVPSNDRITRPYLLGVPFVLQNRRGAVVFVRFGGPKYTEHQMPLAALAAAKAGHILDRNLYMESLTQLELARHKAQLQDDFMATISHELHTPLGFIKGYATSLLRSDTTWDDATQKEFLIIIDEETDHLITLIDRMLDSARLQSGNMAMDLQPVRLDSLLRDETMRVKARNPDLEVSLKLAAAPPIFADGVRLAQVIDNLFDNAIKYAPGTLITIALQVKDDWQTIAFSDQGPGIPAEHIPYLFERFYRVPGQYGKSGTGLGLYICKQIITAHQGRISVRTTPGKGTTFFIELPTHREKNDKEG